jgi:hypothetical protein
MPGLAYGRWNDQQAVLQEMARVWSDGSQAPIAGARSDGLRTFTAFITFQPLNVQRKFGATEFFISLKYLTKLLTGATHSLCSTPGRARRTKTLVGKLEL